MQESSSSFEKRSIGDDLAKAHHRDVASHDVDVAAGLTAGKEVSFTPEEAARIRCVPRIPRAQRGAARRTLTLSPQTED